MPALFALAADPLVSLIDTAFVGRLGTTALGALGVDAAVFGLAFITFNVFQYGVTPLVAKAEGAGRRATTSGIVAESLRWALGLGVAVAAVLTVAAEPVLGLMQAGPDLLPDAMLYLRIRAWAAPAVLVVLVGHGAFRGLHDTVTPLYVTLGLNAVNLILDPVLIFGLDMGIAGAAYATLVAQWVGAAWFYRLLRLRILSTKPEAVEARLLLRVGRDVTIRTFALVGALTVATASAARIGDATVAAHQVVSQLFVFLALITDSLAIAAQALVGSAVGAGDHADLRHVMRRLWSWGILVGVTLAFGVLGLRGILPLFSADAAVIELAGEALVVVAIIQPIGALVFVGDGIYLGAGRFSFLAGSTVIAALCALAVFAWVVAGGGTLWGLWVGIGVMVAIRGLAMVWDQRRGFVAG